MFDFFKRIFPALFLQEVWIDDKGWLQGRNVKRIPIHSSWFYSELWSAGGVPMGVVWHDSDTDPGTADNMFLKRQKALDPKKDRKASWHVSIEPDGTLYQGVSFLCGAWHCLGENRRRIGVELIGHTKRPNYTPEMVTAARQLTQALVNKYGVPRAECGKDHKFFDPGRKVDCGKEWTEEKLPTLLKEIAWRRP